MVKKNEIVQNSSRDTVILNRYPKNKFNVLIPIESMQEYSSMYKPVFNVVHISTNLNDKEIYKQGDEYALSKISLAKLATAANVNIVSSKKVLPSKCERCTEIAKSTRIAPNCGNCPSSCDVAYKVVVSVPEASGGVRYVTATKEVDIVVEKETMKPKQFRNFRIFRNEQCESKALNRALREALHVKATYTMEELKKPFVVTYMVPNADDPEMKKVLLKKYESSSKMLFDSEPVPELAPPETVSLPEPDEGPVEVMEDIDPEPDEEVDPFANICEECGKEIKGFTDGNGQPWTVVDIKRFSQKQYGKDLCAKCLNKKAKQNG